MVTPAFSFGAQVAEVEVDEKTGKVEVKKMWTAHDCGTVLTRSLLKASLKALFIWAWLCAFRAVCNGKG